MKSGSLHGKKCQIPLPQKTALVIPLMASLLFIIPFLFFGGLDESTVSVIRNKQVILLLMFHFLENRIIVRERNKYTWRDVRFNANSQVTEDDGQPNQPPPPPHPPLFLNVKSSNKSFNISIQLPNDPEKFITT